MSKIRMLHIGWVTDSVKTILALIRTGFDPVVVNTDPLRFFEKVPALNELGFDIPVINLYQFNSGIPHIKTARYFLTAMATLTRRLAWSPRHASILKDIIVSKNIELVFAHWGAGILPEISLIKAKCPRVPVVLNLETFPTSCDSLMRQIFEIYLFKRLASLLNGLIIPSKRMKEFVMNLEPMVLRHPYLQKPMCYSKDCCSDGRFDLLRYKDGKPHLIFAGQFNFSSSLNDTREQILMLAEGGIYIHCVKVKGLIHPNIRFFEPFNANDLVTGTFTKFMTQFDGCLVLYNIKRRMIRYSTSIPSRFLIALISGIPVCLPKGELDSCEDILRQFGNGIIYDDVDHLKSTLLDDKTQDQIRINSLKAAPRFILDSQELRKFMEKVTNENTSINTQSSLSS